MKVSGETERVSIRTKLAIWISASLIVVGIVLVLANTRILSGPIEQQLDQLANNICSELVERLAEPVWNMDDQAIRSHFVAYPGDSLGLVYVKVTTEFEDVLFEKQYSDDPAPLTRRAAVIWDDKTIGFVEVRLDSHHLLTTQRAVRRSGYMIVILSTIVSFLVCTAIVNAVVIRPVRKTVSGLRTIAGGNYQYKLTGETTAEMDSINQEINAMSAEIFKRQEQLTLEITTRHKAELDLRNLNEELEERIKVRTAQLRRLARMLASAQDNEQKRIAEGLHDDVAQLLAASRMKIAVASSHSDAAECGSQCRAMLDEVDDLVGQAYERLRLLSFELASSTLYQWGLKDSLVKLCAGMNERYDASFKISGADDLNDFNDTSAAVLFKAAREVLFNVVKHSGVKSATVQLERRGANLALIVEDKGNGFSKDVDAGIGRGLGLFSVKERLHDIEGEVHIDSEQGSHTRVLLTVPWLEKDAGE